MTQTDQSSCIATPRRTSAPVRFRGALALVASIALVVAGCGSSGDSSASDSGPQGLVGIVRNPSPNISDRVLPAVSDGGTERSLAPVDADLTLLYIGYTSCPDVCPTTMADVRTALGELGDDAERIEVAMATVDPTVDTAEALVGYVQSFVPGAVAYRTTDTKLMTEVALDFGASYSVTDTPEGEHQVTHTGALYAIGSDGDLEVTWPFGTSSDDMVNDLRILLEREA